MPESSSCRPRSSPTIDPQSIYRNLYSVLARAWRTRKTALVAVIFNVCFLWLLENIGNIPSGSEHLLHPFPQIRAIRAAQIFILEFSKDGLAELGDKFPESGFANPTGDIARWCKSLQRPGVSLLLPLSVLLLMAY